MTRKLATKAGSRALLPAATIADLDAYFAAHGIVDWTLASRDGLKTLRARRRNGEALTATHYESEGFSERTSSRCRPLGRDQRRLEATRLRARGLTQNAIADRLGVSQRTISGDLSAP